MDAPFAEDLVRRAMLIRDLSSAANFGGARLSHLARTSLCGRSKSWTVRCRDCLRKWRREVPRAHLDRQRMVCIQAGIVPKLGTRWARCFNELRNCRCEANRNFEKECSLMDILGRKRPGTNTLRKSSDEVDAKKVVMAGWVTQQLRTALGVLNPNGPARDGRPLRPTRGRRSSRLQP